MNKKNLRVVISGGGTGGHIFPAISIANGIREMMPTAEILFVGAEGRMEMQRVPEAGYAIKALPIIGFNRKNILANAKVLYCIWKSKQIAKSILQSFKPDVVVGVGGYASGPTLDVATSLNIPTLIQEQNSYAGITNKLLSKKVNVICVAYDGMERFFPAKKICLTGNPVRESLLHSQVSREASLQFFGLKNDKPTVLILGGSLGAKTINESVLNNLQLIKDSEVQFIWQTGKIYAEHISKELELHGKPDNLFVAPFIAEMDQAYKAADLVVSRAGASSISELCLLGKPSILVPSPNVAEDHQTKNAVALVEKNASLLVKDIDAPRALIPLSINTVRDEMYLKVLAQNAKLLAMPNATKDIVTKVMALATRKEV